MSEGISYDWSVNANLTGVDVGVKELDSAAASLKSVEHATKGTEDELKTLRKQLADLRRPGEISKLKEEIAGFSKPVHAMKEGVHEAKEEWEGVGESVKKAHGHLTEFLEFAGIALAIDLVKELTEHVVELGAEIVKAAAGEERTKKVFTLNFGVEGGEKALEYAEKFAQGSEYTEDQSKTFLSTLLNAGVPIKEMDKYMAAAGDVASGFTNKLEGMDRAIEAFRRMTLTGKLEGRALRGLNIGVPQLKELDEYKGKSDKQLKEILEKGTLTTSQVFRIIAGADKQLGDKAVTMGETMSAKLDKLKALPERLFQEFMNSTAFDTLKEKIDHVLERFDPKSPDGQVIIKGIGDIGEALLHVLDGVDIESVMKTVLKTIEAIPAAINAVGAAFHAISDNWKYLKWLNPSGAVAGMVRDKLFDAMTSEPKKSGQKTGYDITTGMAEGIGEGVPAVTKAATNMAKTPADITRRVNEVHSPSKVFERIGLHLGEGLADGIAASGMAAMMEDAITVPALRLPAGGRGVGGISVSLTVNVESKAGGHGAKETGQAIADDIGPSVVSALIDLFERAAAADGSAA